MVQFGPVDLFVYSVPTSKIFKVMFCARKKDIEKCLVSIQETDGCMSLHQFLSREPFHPLKLKPVEVSNDISTFLDFCIFFTCHLCLICNDR